MKLTRFAKYVWFVLIINLGVILWGAYVRATGSGAGCGSHWPLCNGEVIPRTEQLETMIEFIHRASSGIAFILVMGMLVWALQIYPRGNYVRKATMFSMFFMVTEALLGAGLVLFELVGENTSTARAISISVHLVNTFFLLGSISLTAWWSSGGAPMKLKWKEAASWLLILGFLGVLILGMSGALTALGDTLFPVSSLEEGLRQDFSSTAHFLVRLRILHPTIAVIVSLYLITMIGWVNSRNPSGRTKNLGRAVVSLLILQLLAGLINIILLAPVWMQLLHLFMSDVIWICLVLFAADIFGTAQEVPGRWARTSSQTAAGSASST